jgi:hypothetical protein
VRSQVVESGSGGLKAEPSHVLALGGVRGLAILAVLAPKLGLNRLRKTGFWTATAVTTFFCAFVLPFYFPMSEPVYSAAYTAGENNRVAAIAVAAISLLVAFVYRSFAVTGENEKECSDFDRVDRTQLGIRYLWWGLGATLALTALLGSIIVRRGPYYGDEGYFLAQLRTGIVFHRAIYREFEFPYGPVLYYWPATFVRALAPLGVSMAAAYMTSLVVMEALGVGLLFYTVKALPIRRGLKAAAFALITFCAFDMLLGLNYAALRCILPFATVVLLSKQRNLGRAMVVAFLGEIVQLGVSPEIGIAFGGAAAAYGLYCGVVSGWRWMGVGVAAVTGAAAFAKLIGHDYFLTLGEMAKGGYNLILEPLPFTLVLLAAVVALSPVAVARGVRAFNRGANSWAGMLVGLYVAMLGMLPAALSRSDPLHNFFDGVGAYLLSFVAIDRSTRVWRRVWIVVVALTFAATQFQEFHAFREGIINAVRQVPEPYDDPNTVDRISQAVGPAKVAFPWGIPLQMVDRLTRTGQYQPGYFCGSSGAFDEASEERRVADMRSAEFLLVPINQALVFEDEIDNSGVKRWLRFGFTYRARRVPFYEGARMLQELDANWKPVGSFGVYTLYKQIP